MPAQVIIIEMMSVACEVATALIRIVVSVVFPLNGLSSRLRLFQFMKSSSWYGAVVFDQKTTVASMIEKLSKLFWQVNNKRYINY